MRITGEEINRNTPEKPAVYWVKNMKTKEIVYIGKTMEVVRRCLKDHQKPSQELMNKMVNDVTGNERSYYESKDNYTIYSEIAKLCMRDYVFEIIKDFSDRRDGQLTHDMEWYEKIMIDHYKPKFNINFKYL
jgi:hypothetical protein